MSRLSCIVALFIMIATSFARSPFHALAIYCTLVAIATAVAFITFEVRRNLPLIGAALRREGRP